MLKGRAIEFRSTRVEQRGSRLEVTGELELFGFKRSLDFALNVDEDGRIAGSAFVKQTDWKMKPFSALFGTLKVADVVEVSIDARVPATVARRRSMVELDHRFETGNGPDYNWDAILDLDRIIPCVEGGKVLERTSPRAGQGRDHGQDGRDVDDVQGTVEVVERDDEAHRAVLRVKSRDTGGSGYANADVTFDLDDGGGERPHGGADQRQGGVDGGGRRADRARRPDQGLHHQAREDLRWPSGWSCAGSGRVRSHPTARPRSRTTPTGPVFRANGPYDYVCVECGNVLAASMGLESMTKRVRIKCGRCKTVNVAVFDAKGET